MLCLTASCATFSVNGDIPKTPDSKTKSETIHSSLYGFHWSEWKEDKCDSRKGISRVRIHTNAVYLFVSVASLGLYVPQNVTWWCDGAKPADTVDDDVYVLPEN